MDRKERIWHAMTPEMQAVVKEWALIDREVRQRVRQGRWPKEKYARSRAVYRYQLAPWNKGGPVPKRCQETVWNGPYGPLTLRLYEMTEGHGAPILYIHGGGYIVGDLDTHDRLMRELSAISRRAVIGIDYHLAPMATYPVALDEVMDVIQRRQLWSDLWGLSAHQVILAGDSCGAGLALASAFRLQTTDDITALLLYYGDYGLADSFSRRRFGGPWDGMTRAAMARWERLYLPNGKEPGNPDHALAGQPIPKHFPPTFVAVSDLDPLLDDSRVLAAKLADVHRGELYIAHGVLHTYLQMIARLPEAEKTLQASAAFLAEKEDRYGLSDRH